MEITCKICNCKIDRDDFDDHLKSDHCMDYDQYYNYCYDVIDGVCSYCNKSIGRISPWFDIPSHCTCKSEMRTYLDSIMDGISKIYKMMIDDPFIKLFILNDDLRTHLKSFDLPSYSSYIKTILPGDYDPINLFSIRLRPGLNPFIKCNEMYNVAFDKSSYSINRNELMSVEDGKYRFSIENDEYEISLPEKTEYRNNNHYKYNILNRKSEPQSSKKLLLRSGECIKFYNTNIDNCKSIIKVTKNGNHIYSTSLTSKELDYIKYYVMANTTVLSRVSEVLLVLIRNSKYLYDRVFLKNKVLVNPKGKFDMSLDWVVRNGMMNSNDQLNMSIL